MGAHIQSMTLLSSGARHPLSNHAGGPGTVGEVCATCDGLPAPRPSPHLRYLEASLKVQVGARCADAARQQGNWSESSPDPALLARARSCLKTPAASIRRSGAWHRARTGVGGGGGAQAQAARMCEMHRKGSGHNPNKGVTARRVMPTYPETPLTKPTWPEGDGNRF